jgi:uncharacterized membrane-anchored protein YitT (DUF2179 family)
LKESKFLKKKSSQIIIDTLFRKTKKNNLQSDEESFQGNNKYKFNVSYFITDAMFIIFAIVSAGFGLKGFLIPNSFIDGGVTGISLLTQHITGISLSVLLIVINLPFLLVGFSQIGKTFAIKSIVAIIGLALAIYLIPYPVVTTDKLLVAIFGGFFLGLGIGLSVRGGAVIDGTEVLAVYLSKRTGLTIGDIILIFNTIIFLFGAYILSVEIALYAILTYIAASRTVDFIIEGVEEYTGVSVISNKSEEIRLAVIENLGRGVTLYSGKRGFAKQGDKLQKVDIVYTVVTRLELAKLKREIDKIDPDAFIFMNSIKDAHGGVIKKRPLRK